jgi:hypothetical protein
MPGWNNMVRLYLLDGTWRFPAAEPVKLESETIEHGRYTVKRFAMTSHILFPLLLAAPARAQGGASSSPPPGHSTVSQAPATASHGADDISEKLADPIANMISVPFQFNYDANTGAGNDGDRLTMNFQPVVPVPLGDDWLLITRTIVPVVYQDDVVDDGGSSQFGLGDVQQSFFLSPRESGIPHVKWGVGPVFLWPTATNDSLGTEKWGAGPAGLLLYQKNPWTVGVLANHIWSYAGDDDRADVNQTFLQPFSTYQLGQGWSVVAQLEATYAWDESQWTIPFSTGVSKVTHVGRLPLSLGVQGRYWLEGPDGAPEWGARFIMTFVFPE